MLRKFIPKHLGCRVFLYHLAHPVCCILPNAGPTLDHRNPRGYYKILDAPASLLYIMDGVDYGEEEPLLSFLADKLGSMRFLSLATDSPHALTRLN
ncbi:MULTISPECIES: hypothetical protein [unclassified Sphingomonas]|uniref:hypothetical protein n=1 Tax=unclassified Sphingomonas TaxID=196159 RepID=UPI0021513FE7|nr:MULTISPECIES: hypothetical protein [unclassified Sphingomonas]MCR5869364.1 hypothetical protein [Sphingomonas sp. J344]UUX98905.1 hypothetical protein LRS08_15575 [Sphingomonas sp. J315]